jgi:hypothetical protein
VTPRKSDQFPEKQSSGKVVVHTIPKENTRLSNGISFPVTPATLQPVPSQFPDLTEIKQSPSFGGQTFDLRRKSLEEPEKRRVSNSFMQSGKTLDTTRIVTDLQEPTN